MADAKKEGLVVRVLRLADNVDDLLIKGSEMKKKVNLNTLVSKVAGLGVPGLVLVIAMSVSGWTGAAAITAALAALGGPLGMLGGVALLGILVMLSNGLSEYGFETVFKGVVKRLHEQGETTDQILVKIDNYPISQSLKRSLREALNECSSSNA